METIFKSLLLVMGFYEKKLLELMGPDDYRSFAQKCEAEGFREAITQTKKGLFNEQKSV